MGRWLARLKKHESPGTYPGEPRQPPEVYNREGSLGFQGYPPAPFQDFETAPANDPALGLADSDRCCWPHSPAMNTREISTFMVRLSRFNDKGLNFDEAEWLADELMRRDRDPSNDRRYCPECLHLQGRGLWRCGNYQRAGVGRDLPKDMIIAAQRCSGFVGYLQDS